jgi:hypothetical protein
MRGTLSRIALEGESPPNRSLFLMLNREERRRDSVDRLLLAAAAGFTALQRRELEVDRFNG